MVAAVLAPSRCRPAVPPYCAGVPGVYAGLLGSGHLSM